MLDVHVPTTDGRQITLPLTDRIEQQTETGTMRVATPETTAFDLVRYPAGAGHLSSAATVLSELAERLEARALVTIAPWPANEQVEQDPAELYGRKPPG